MKIHISVENFNEKNQLSNFDKELNDDMRFRILQRHKSLSKFRDDSNRFKNEISFFKHKYFKLSFFYNNATKWETWKIHFITKVQIDYYDFFFEWHKINYVKNKTRENAQAIIWHKAKSNFFESYKDFKKLIENLNNVFEKKEQNKHKTLFQQFFSFDFAMKIKNKSKTFEKFLTRFTSTINSLRFIENDKITHLYKNLFDQFTKKIYHLNAIAKYSKYVKSVRQIINQIKFVKTLNRTRRLSISLWKANSRTSSKLVKIRISKKNERAFQNQNSNFNRKHVDTFISSH